MTSRQQIVAGVLLIAVLAAGLRFFRLGDWSFDVDEIATLIESQSLFSDAQVPDNEIFPGTYQRLPRIIPLGYVIQNAGYSIFGHSEIGSRVVPALLGVATIVLVYLLLVPVSGQLPALVTSLLLAMWPEHLCYSQFNRFYAAAILFAYLCMLVGSFVLETTRRFVPFLVVALAIAALLCHTVAGAAYALVMTGVLIWALARRRAPGMFTTVMLLGGVAVLGGVLIFHVLPRRGWAAGADWGDSPTSAVLAAINRIGWPIVLLSVLGAVMTMCGEKTANWYWLGCFAMSWVVIFALPFVAISSARDVLPLTLPAFVLAGHAVASIYTMIRAKSRFAALAWVAVSLLLELPSLASYYADGSRPDFRGGAHYVAEHSREGDCVCYLGGRKRALDKYAPACTPSYSVMADPVARLKALMHTHTRVWVVLPGYRSVAVREVDRLLDTCFSRELHLEKMRYDYRRNTMDVLLFDPARPRSPSLVAASEREEMGNK